MSPRDHWDSVYRSKLDNQVSWTQAEPRLSFSLIAESLQAGSVIDVGGGSSILAGRLLKAGYHVAVLDISAASLDRAAARLGQDAGQIRWIVGDLTQRPDLGRFDLWHDRAVFHFLIKPEQRAAYATLLRQTVPVGGHAIIATFAPNGPEQCSGLSVRRYDARLLAAELGEGLEMVKSVPELHRTPWGDMQSFQYSIFKRVGT